MKKISNTRRNSTPSVPKQENKQKTKAIVESGISNRFLFPIALAVALVPLILLIHQYTTDLEEFPWYSSGGNGLFDYMLYFKGFFLTILAGVIIFMLVYQGARKKIRLPWDRRDIPPVVALLLFAVLSLVSAILADHKSDAFLGGYDHFEGCFVLISYCICFYMAFGFARAERLLQFMMNALLIGSTVIGALGSLEQINICWYSSEFIMNFVKLLSPVKNIEASVTAPIGLSYATLGNSNYVGSYVAIALPFTIYLIFRGQKAWRRILAGITSVLLLITLYGSQSTAGIIAVAAGIGVGAFFLLPYLKRGIRIVILVLGIVVVAGGVYFFINHELQKCQGAGQEVAIEDIKNDGSALTVHTTDGKTLLVEVKNVEIAYQFVSFQLPMEEVLTVKDKDSGKDLNLSYGVNPVVENETGDGTEATGGESYAKLEEEGYPALTFLYDVQYLSSEETTSGQNVQLLELKIIDGEKEFAFAVLDSGVVKFYNEDAGWMDDVHVIKKLGFRGYEDFMSSRGYIWSRTFPILPKYLLVGAGADNFVYAFPNDDHIGRTYFYRLDTITNKPHNMFLQIWVQDGLIAMLAFLFLYGLFIVRAIRMAFRGKNGGNNRKIKDVSAGECVKVDGKETSVGEVEANGTSDSVLDATEKPNHWWNGPLTAKGVATMAAIATTAYLVSGLANDSIVCVAPVYWVMLGVGYAAEVVVHRENTNRAATEAPTNNK